MAALPSLAQLLASILMTKYCDRSVPDAAPAAGSGSGGTAGAAASERLRESWGESGAVGGAADMGPLPLGKGRGMAATSRAEAGRLSHPGCFVGITPVREAQPVQSPGFAVLRVLSATLAAYWFTCFYIVSPPSAIKVPLHPY